MQFNTSYLNRTPHKFQRAAKGFKPFFVVWHETGGYGTLEWNIKPEAQASFNYLILRDGSVYWYVDETAYVAWHGGAASQTPPYYGTSRWTINNRLFWVNRYSYFDQRGVWCKDYRASDVNFQAIGVELEGLNNGAPITQAQTDAAVDLMLYFNTTYGIPLELPYHPEHCDIAPVYKSDGRGYSSATLLAFALKKQKSNQASLPDLALLGVPEDKQSISLLKFGRMCERNNLPLTGSEIGRVYQYCQQFNIDAAVLFAIIKREGFGKSPLQQITNNVINIKAVEGDWRKAVYKDEKGTLWYTYESFLLGVMAAILHFKNEYGAKRKLYTIREIIPVFAPASDGNDVESYINGILTDVKYMQEH